MRRILAASLFLCFLAITFIAQAQTPYYYFPTGPCRLADTRDASQPPGFGPPSMVATQTRTFTPPTNGNCHIPDDATAYALNLTVVPSTGYLAYVTVWPDDQKQPVVSTLNSWDGRIKANSLIVGAGAMDQGIDVYATDNTDVVLDITGYFVGPNFYSGDTGLNYFNLPGVAACNVYNTLTGTNVPGAGHTPIPANTMTKINVAMAPYCAIPGNASAYALNFTVIPVGQQPLAYLQAWPGDQPATPHTSVLNAPTGTTVANMSIVESSDGTINVYSTADTDLSVDIYGYFAPSGPDPLALYPLTPARCWDTRPNAIDLGPYGVDIHTANSPCYSSFPPDFLPNAEDYVLNATVIPLTNGTPGGLGALYVWPAGVEDPQLPVLAALDGQVTSNMTITPSLFGLNSPGAINTRVSNPTNVLFDVSAFFATDQITVASSHLPDAQDNVTYYAPNYSGYQMIGWGGVGPPYTWTGGNFPAALGISPGGLVSGCPTDPPGTYQPFAQVSDAAGNVSPLTVLSINVTGPPPPPLISTVLLPPAPVNQPYSYQLAVSGGLAPYTWSIIAGSLPDNMTMSSSGLITGTPPQVDNGNTYTFTVQVTDSECPSGLTNAVTLSIAVPSTS
jgi:hypothetical protein